MHNPIIRLALQAKPDPVSHDLQTSAPNGIHKCRLAPSFFEKPVVLSSLEYD